MKKLFFPFLLLTINLFAQTPCEAGKAGNYDCLGLDLQARISAPNLGAEEHQGIWVNDIWGWVDPLTEKEYALVGMSNGTSFVDVSDPVNPVVLGVLVEHNSQDNSSNEPLHDGAKSIWRDIKVYQNYAYIVSEDPGHGLQVFDLTDLRDVENPSKDNRFSEAGHYAGIGKAHNLAINEETGFAYAVGFNANDGSTCSIGGLHMIDLSNPVVPEYAGCYDVEGYIHDTQCVIYQGPDEDHVGKEICFNSNGNQGGPNTITIVDVTSKGSPALIYEADYGESAYTHQGWLTEDHKYFLSNDELDELSFDRNSRTLIWDVQDLDSPQLLGYYEHGTKAIDHNLYTVENYIYESNYTNGLRVLDTTGISEGKLREVAYFDSFVSSDATIFDGTWSNYPYFPSGNIIFSDITNGLFVVRMQSMYFIEQPQDYVACVGEHLDIPLEANGEGLTFQWQIDEGDGFQNIDDFERYKNTTTTAMHAHTLEKHQDGNKFRCVVSNGSTDIISEPMTLHVLDSPVASFTYEITSVTGNISFTNTSAFADEFVWKFGDGAMGSDESPEYKYEEDGSYEVMLIALNGCTSDTSTQVLDLIVAGNPDFLDKYRIYPTIVDDICKIESSVPESTLVEVYSLQGQLLLNQNTVDGNTELSFSGFNNGIYLLKIIVRDQVITKKVVVTR